MVDAAIVARVREYLSELAEVGIPVARGVLFGSFARGEQRPDSDIDLLVLSPLFDLRKDFETVNALWRLTCHVDNRIEPHAVGVREFETDDSSPLIGIARREGVVVETPVFRGTATRRRGVAAVKEGKARYVAKRRKG